MQANRQLLSAIMFLAGAVLLALLYVTWRDAQPASPVVPVPVVQQRQNQKPLHATGATLAVLDGQEVRDLGIYKLAGTQKSPTIVSEVRLDGNNAYVLEKTKHPSSRDKYIMSRFNIETKEQTVLATGSGFTYGESMDAFIEQRGAMKYTDDKLFLMVATPPKNRALIEVDIRTGKSIEKMTWIPKEEEELDATIAFMDTKNGKQLVLREEYRAQPSMTPDSVQYSVYDKRRDSFVKTPYEALGIREDETPFAVTEDMAKRILASGKTKRHSSSLRTWQNGSWRIMQASKSCRSSARIHLFL